MSAVILPLSLQSRIAEIQTLSQGLTPTPSAVAATASVQPAMTVASLTASTQSVDFATVLSQAIMPLAQSPSTPEARLQG
ncbi:hypothetical protein [Demequina litorisediminis]|uniref:hypothetical protein n=1 Tax=Demequina litorisediminis TaxID=1849022 RepID=UPI0024E16F8B|nr:hypothetical protein [Demequina litorisediminis]